MTSGSSLCGVRQPGSCWNAGSSQGATSLGSDSRKSYSLNRRLGAQNCLLAHALGQLPLKVMHVGPAAVGVLRIRFQYAQQDQDC